MALVHRRRTEAQRFGAIGDALLGGGEQHGEDLLLLAA